MRGKLAIVTVAVVAGTRLLAQTTATSPAPKFDVTSIKQSTSQERDNFISNRGARFTANNVSVRDLFWLAYRLPDFQIVNLPKWSETDRFDVSAVGQHEWGREEFRAMLLSLLEDRFALRTHRETRETGVYNLLIADVKGKVGVSITKSSCEPGRCGAIHSANLRFQSEGITLDRFAEWLSDSVSRTVQNKTNLDGRYDINLAWSNDPTVDPSQPSIFTALREQLGLRLESGRGPVEVLVVDHLEHPTPD